MLNRSSEFDSLYDSEGRLQGGLAALGTLAKVIHPEGGVEMQSNGSVSKENEEESTLPSTLPSLSSKSPPSTEREANSSEDGSLEEIAVDDEKDTPPPDTSPPIPSLPTTKPPEQSTSHPASSEPIFIGDKMKACFLEINVLGTLLVSNNMPSRFVRYANRRPP